jgi:DNA-binding GntR family transcriptional regulator
MRYHLLIADALFDRNPPQTRLLMQSHMQDAFGTVLASEAQAHQVGA